jgi:hypothetical protein
MTNSHPFIEQPELLPSTARDTPQPLPSAQQSVYVTAKDSLCRGLVPQVPWVTSYTPKIYILPVPTSGKRLGNYASHTGYSPTILAEEEGPPT